jgi:uncharacterized protein YdeI (BOF family)
MKLKYSLLLLSALSSTVYAKTYNLDTVINNRNINTIVTEMVKTFSFSKGTVDPNTPIGISGTYDLDENNKLTSINIEHASFKALNIPLIGDYQTDISISGTIDKGNCNKITVKSSNVNMGHPALVNIVFSRYLSYYGSTALTLLVLNADLSKYCSSGTKPSYQVFFY